MKPLELAPSRKGCCRKIAVTLIDRSMSVYGLIASVDINFRFARHPRLTS